MSAGLASKLGIVTRDEVTILATTNLMVSIRVECSATTFRAGVVETVKWDPKPVAQTAAKLLVLEMKAQSRTRDPIQPDPSVRQPRGQC